MRVCEGLSAFPLPPSLELSLDPPPLPVSLLPFKKFCFFVPETVACPSGNSVFCRYKLTAASLQSDTMLLNGKPLVVRAGALPPLDPQAETSTGVVEVPPTSIVFVHWPAAACP